MLVMRRYEWAATGALVFLIVFGLGMIAGEVMAATKTAAPATPNALQVSGTIGGKAIPVTFTHHDATGKTHSYTGTISGAGVILSNAGAVTVEFQSDQVYYSGFGP